jgi:hypothetical protein
MKRDSRSILLLIFTAALSGASFGQTKQQQRNVTVNSQNGTAEVIDQNGRLFVDVSALASIGKGSVSFSGAGIVLTFPAVGNRAATAGTAESPAVPSHPPNSSALSQEFMKAGIEEIARLREWATTLASALADPHELLQIRLIVLGNTPRILAGLKLRQGRLIPQQLDHRSNSQSAG